MKQKLFFLFTFAFLPLASHAKFVDMDVTHPHFHAIKFLDDEDIIRGYEMEDGTYFRARQKVNRAEALKMLLLAAEIPMDPKAKKTFPDVDKNAWFADYVHTAANKNIVKGFTDGNFHPEKQVSRAEFLKMLTLSFDIPFEEMEDPEEWFDPYFGVAENFRIVDEPDLSPYESLSRGDIAEYIYRAHILKTNRFETKYVYSGSGSASYYDQGFAGNPTASGEIYDPMDMTVAHRILPFGTRLKIWKWSPSWSWDDKDFIVVRVNDRGPYHEDRILDLSRKAFESLAPTSRGVIDVIFEVYSDNLTVQPTIPEQIRPTLEEETKEEGVPEIIAREFESGRTRSGSPSPETAEGKKPFIKKKTKKLVRKKSKPPLTPNRLKGQINYLHNDFFPHITLRRPIPQKVVLGTVIQVGGTVKEKGKKKATIFAQDLDTNKQRQFTGPVSGDNFSISVPMLESGNFHLGVVFDDERQSKVGRIEVAKNKYYRKFPATDKKFVSSLDAQVVPEESRVVFNWASGENRLTKIIFSQGNNKSPLLIGDQVSHLSLPYAFFDRFKSNRNIAIDIFQADSEDGTLETQTTNWQQSAYRNYVLAPGFPDTEKESISVHKFPRFLKNLNPVKLDGKILAPDVQIPNHIFLVKPEGMVEQIPMQKSGDHFSFEFTPKSYGTYILEIVSDQGEILFNRGMYIYKKMVLPVTAWDQTFVRSESAVGVRNWINQLRKKYRKHVYTGDTRLDEFAQHYADRMAREKFISHTTPEGLTFRERLKAANMLGEFAENLGYGSTLELALHGLENSASHRANLLSERWERVGIGIAKNVKGEFYVVQIFSKNPHGKGLVPKVPTTAAEKLAYEIEEIKKANALYLRAYEIINEAKNADVSLSHLLLQILATAENHMEVATRKNGPELAVRKKIWLLWKKAQVLIEKCEKTKNCSKDAKFVFFLKNLTTQLESQWNNWSENPPFEHKYQTASKAYQEVEKFTYLNRKTQSHLDSKDRERIAKAMGQNFSFKIFLKSKEILENFCPNVDEKIQKKYPEEYGAWCNEKSQKSLDLLKYQFERNISIPLKYCNNYIQMVGNHCSELNHEYQRFRAEFLGN